MPRPTATPRRCPTTPSRSCSRRDPAIAGDGLVAARRAELLERPLDVPADAGPRDAELRRDLLVGLALLHQPQDVGLAPGDLEARNREHGTARSLLVAGGALDRGDDVGDLADHLVDHAAQEVDLRALGLRLGEQRGALDRVAEPLGERPEDVAVVRADVAPREVAVGVDE